MNEETFKTITKFDELTKLRPTQESKLIRKMYLNDEMSAFEFYSKCLDYLESHPQL